MGWRTLTLTLTPPAGQAAQGQASPQQGCGVTPCAVCGDDDAIDVNDDHRIGQQVYACHILVTPATYIALISNEKLLDRCCRDECHSEVRPRRPHPLPALD